MRQRAFSHEKILGSNDKEAALAAGYSPSVEENTKQKIWEKRSVHDEFERLKQRFWGCCVQYATTETANSNQKLHRDNFARGVGKDGGKQQNEKSAQRVT